MTVFAVVEALLVTMAVETRIADAARPSLRAQRVAAIEYTVQWWYRGHANSLPPSLAAATIRTGDNAIDPVTNAPISYRRVDSSRYQLCTAQSCQTFDATADLPRQRYHRAPGFWWDALGCL